MLTFRRVFSCRIFSMRKPRPALTALVPGRTCIGGLGIQQTKKYPAGSEPAGLYIINKGGCCGSPRRAVDAPPRVINMKKVSLRQQGNFFLCFLHMFFAYLAFASCYVSPSVVVPAAYVTGRWCHPASYIWGSFNLIYIIWQIFQKIKITFFKGAGLRPSASGERHEIIQPFLRAHI